MQSAIVNGQGPACTVKNMSDTAIYVLAFLGSYTICQPPDPLRYECCKFLKPGEEVALPCRMGRLSCYLHPAPSDKCCVDYIAALDALLTGNRVRKHFMISVGSAVRVLALLVPVDYRDDAAALKKCLRGCSADIFIELAADFARAVMHDSDGAAASLVRRSSSSNSGAHGGAYVAPWLALVRHVVELRTQQDAGAQLERRRNAAVVFGGQFEESDRKLVVSGDSLGLVLSFPDN